MRRRANHPTIPHGVGQAIIRQMEDGEARVVRAEYVKSLRYVAHQMGVFLSVRPYRGDKYHMKRVSLQQAA